MLYKIKLVKDTAIPSLNAEDVAGLLLESAVEGAEIVNEASIDCYTTSLKFLEPYLPPGWKIEATIELDNKNWVQECEQVFESVRAGALLIRPIASALSLPKETSSDSIYIIPGLGFGTGHHQTTKSIIELIQHPFVQQHPPRTALDVGTGSGILAIGISKLYGTATTAFDIDPDAVENAKENVSLNRLEDKIRLEVGTINLYSNSYDIVIANIYAEVLVDLKDELKRCVNHSGALVISGIMEVKRDLIHEHFKTSPWNFIDERVENGWVSILMEKRG